MNEHIEKLQKKTDDKSEIIKIYGNWYNKEVDRYETAVNEMPKNEMKQLSIRSDIDKVDSIKTKVGILELIHSNAAAKFTIVSDVKIQDNIPASFMLVKGPEGTNSEKHLRLKKKIIST